MSSLELEGLAGRPVPGGRAGAKSHSSLYGRAHLPGLNCSGFSWSHCSNLICCSWEKCWISQQSREQGLVSPHKGQEQDKYPWPTWPGWFVLQPEVWVTLQTVFCEELHSSQWQAAQEETGSTLELFWAGRILCAFGVSSLPARKVPSSYVLLSQDMQERLRHGPCDW